MLKALQLSMKQLRDTIPIGEAALEDFSMWDLREVSFKIGEILLRRLVAHDRNSGERMLEEYGCSSYVCADIDYLSGAKSADFGQSVGLSGEHF